MRPDEAVLTFLGFYLWLGPILLFYRYVWPGKRVAFWVATVPIWWLLGILFPLGLLVAAIVFILYSSLKKDKAELQDNPPASLSKAIKDRVDQRKDWVLCPNCNARQTVRTQDAGKMTICKNCGHHFRIMYDQIYAP